MKNAIPDDMDYNLQGLGCRLAALQGCWPWYWSFVASLKTKLWILVLALALKALKSSVLTLMCYIYGGFEHYRLYFHTSEESSSLFLPISKDINLGPWLSLRTKLWSLVLALRLKYLLTSPPSLRLTSIDDYVPGDLFLCGLLSNVQSLTRPLDWLPYVAS